MILNLLWSTIGKVFCTCTTSAHIVPCLLPRVQATFARLQFYWELLCTYMFSLAWPRWIWIMVLHRSYWWDRMRNWRMSKVDGPIQCNWTIERSHYLQRNDISQLNISLIKGLLHWGQSAIYTLCKYNDGVLPKFDFFDVSDVKHGLKVRFFVGRIF